MDLALAELVIRQRFEVLRRALRCPDALLTRALAHPDGEVVKQVLTEGASARVVVEAAAWALSDPRWDVRAAAARALEIGGGAGERALLEAAAQRETDPLAHQALVQAAKALEAR